MSKRTTALMALALGIVAALPSSVLGEIYVVAASAKGFSPSEITITEGDTVRWQWGGEPAASTSGGVCGGDLGVWRIPFSELSPIFERTFGEPGIYHYASISQCGLGLQGVVTVQKSLKSEGFNFRPSPAADVKVLFASFRPSPASDIRTLFARPNPVVTGTEILFSFDRPARVWIDLVDALGRHVATRGKTAASAGSHSILWDRRFDSGERAPAGVYYARVRGQQTRPLRLVVVD